MPRKPRAMTLSEINHIMLRGIGHMDLFFKTEDFQRFTETLMRFQKTDDITIYAYCLMSNHVHLLVKAAPEKIPVFLKRVEVSYATYFNGIYQHVGHLFQNRYKSEAVTDKAYFLTALKYILLNPQAAGICSWREYKWSSGHCYITGENDRITDCQMAIELLGTQEEIIRFVDSKNDRSGEMKFIEPEEKGKRFSEEEALAIICRISGNDNPTRIKALKKVERNTVLNQLKKAGLSIRQIERITGINRNIIQRAK